jgi:bifunctional non-homologous end joining protein LigD
MATGCTPASKSGRARLPTRTDLDWTSKYPAIADAATARPLGSAYTDGESCGVRADGITSFSLIQNASDTRNGEALVIFQFDLLHVDGKDPSAPWSSARRVDFARSAVRQ